MNTIKTEVLANALRFHGVGFNVFPVDKHKHPVILNHRPDGEPIRYSWKRWQTERQTTHVVEGMPWHLADGIGGLGGPSDLIHFDIDGAADDRALNMILLACGLPLDYQWAVWTPGKVKPGQTRRNGYHIWLHCPGLDLDGKARLDRPARAGMADHIELRGRGVYAVLPGSPHPEGGYYQFLAGPDYFPTEEPVTWGQP
ncbi:MAG: bifunctional DNA primase/polymerase [Caldilineaceae bacterium]|nr:bifunctional DNA primase/polymerase [Caldilineaceae bacterium]